MKGFPRPPPALPRLRFAPSHMITRLPPRLLYLWVPLILPAACGTIEEPVTAPVVLADGGVRASARSLATLPATTEGEIPAFLRSSAPIPLPEDLPIAPPSASDPRAWYDRTLLENDHRRLVVEVLTLRETPVGAVVDVAIVEADEGPLREQFLIPAGATCESGPIAVGDVVLLHPLDRHLRDPRSPVWVGGFGGMPTVVRTELSELGVRLARYPWGPEAVFAPSETTISAADARRGRHD